MHKKILESLSDIIFLNDLSGNLIYTNSSNPSLDLKRFNDDIYISSNNQKIYYKKEKTIELDGKTCLLIYYKENTELYNDIIRQSNDSITGIPNRLMVNKYLENISDTNKTFTIAMIDIDKFKEINDRFGHLFGDQILAELASILKSEISYRDFVGRYGGEEFIIVLNSLTFYEGLVKLDELRQKIQNHFHGFNYEITISIGVSQYFEGNPIINNIEEADKALYRVKENGRNNISFFDYYEQDFILMHNNQKKKKMIV